MSFRDSALHRALKKSGKTQIALAKEIGVDRGVFGRILREQQAPTRDQAIWIAKALGTTVEEIFPSAEFRGHEIEQQKEAQIAERVLLLESRADELLVRNEVLEAQQKELIQSFSAKLSEEQARVAELNVELANREQKIAELKKELATSSARLWLHKLQSDQTKQALERQMQALEAQVKAANARAAAGGGAAVALAGLSALAILARSE